MEPSPRQKYVHLFLRHHTPLGRAPEVGVGPWGRSLFPLRGGTRSHPTPRRLLRSADVGEAALPAGPVLGQGV